MPQRKDGACTGPLTRHVSLRNCSRLGIAGDISPMGDLLDATADALRRSGVAVIHSPNAARSAAHPDSPPLPGSRAGVQYREPARCSGHTRALHCVVDGPKPAASLADGDGLLSGAAKHPDRSCAFGTWFFHVGCANAWAGSAHVANRAAPLVQPAREKPRVADVKRAPDPLVGDCAEAGRRAGSSLPASPTGA